MDCGKDCEAKKRKSQGRVIRILLLFHSAFLTVHDSKKGEGVLEVIQENVDVTI